MISPQYPENEKYRQNAVEKYQLLDTLPEDNYDNITTLMSYICDAPISLITLLDKKRNFLKSHYGIPFNESPRDISFCGHAINSESPITIIKDAREDIRFIDNPLVSEYKAIFYAGAPLVDSDGYKLGTLCVYDHKPRQLTKQQIKALISMSKQVVSLFEQRYQNLKLLQYQERLRKRNENLKTFARIVSHDLKSPLSNIISLTELLEEENQGFLNEESLQYIEYLKTSSNSLKNYIDGLLRFYNSDDLLLQKQEKTNIKSLLQEVKMITNISINTVLNLHSEIDVFFTNKAALMQILINLITNAIKYNSKPKKVININLLEIDNFYEFTVKDNGDGIPKEHLNKIFELFSVVGVPDKDGNIGTGIGLATVKKIVENLGGKITVSSIMGEGSIFQFSLSKKFRLPK
ncbi:ATPase [Flavivirga aquatica]|uniref:histidine kinase n=1 Tax=Flavivirga aquatica TaxID=1849968 RepID=A0A1E5TE69_9FLAO|nr:GAF domain-containing sensor histidine kinase [Flavivirga aquatica]OEK09648.1 ATPase [Flavivirga aquatica]